MRTGAFIFGVFCITLVGGTQAAPPPAAVASQESTLAGDDKKVMCSYLAYGVRQFVCGEPPIEDVKKKCEEKGSREHGEKISCSCTDDPNYIQDMCD